jgi:hypothetical protein
MCRKCGKIYMKKQFDVDRRHCYQCKPERAPKQGPFDTAMADALAAVKVG